MSLHGDSGPLQVSDQKEPRPITHAFIAAASQMQHRRVEDFNRGDNEGVGLYQVTQFHDPMPATGKDVQQQRPMCIRSRIVQT